MNTIVQFCYGAKLNLHNGSKFWRKKLIWFQNFYYIKKAAIVSNFCLIGKIPHDFLILTSIELAPKTFIGIQVKISVEWADRRVIPCLNCLLHKLVHFIELELSALFCVLDPRR